MRPGSIHQKRKNRKRKEGACKARETNLAAIQRKKYSCTHKKFQWEKKSFNERRSFVSMREGRKKVSMRENLNHNDKKFQWEKKSFKTYKVTNKFQWEKLSISLKSQPKKLQTYIATYIANLSSLSIKDLLLEYKNLSSLTPT